MKTFITLWRAQKRLLTVMLLLVFSVVTISCKGTMTPRAEIFEGVIHYETHPDGTTTYEFVDTGGSITRRGVGLTVELKDFLDERHNHGSGSTGDGDDLFDTVYVITVEDLSPNPPSWTFETIDELELFLPDIMRAAGFRTNDKILSATLSAIERNWMSPELYYLLFVGNPLGQNG